MIAFPSSVAVSNMTNFYKPTQIINSAVVSTPLYQSNDLMALSVVANENIKSSKELIDEVLKKPVPSIPLVYVNETSKSSNIGNDSDVKKSVIKYYYYKLLEKWIYDDMVGILAFVKLDNKTPHFINPNDDFSIEKTIKESKSNLNIKIDFIKETFFTKDFVKKILKKIVNHNNISWYDLYDYESNVKNTLYLKTLKFLKKRTSE